VQEDEYLRDGMTEDVITELSKIKDLRVYPRSSVLSYRDKPVTAQQIGLQLNASFVLSGTMRRADDRVRITVQLVETQTGHSVWAERYDRKLTDVFELQEEIARSIAQALRITLSPQEERAIASKPTENPQVYDYYLRGRNYTRRATRADLEFAIQMFEKAIELEPEFALSHAGLANVCGLFYDWYEQDDRWIQKGLDASERALALAPDLAEGLAARARIFWGQRKCEQAIEFARKAVERKFDCEGAYWIMGLAYFALERCEEGASLIQPALRASGDDYNVYVPFINILGYLKRDEENRKLRLQQMHVLKQQLEWVPEDVRARMLLSTNYAYFGNQTEAVQELQKAVALRPEDANLLYNAACTYGVLQMKREALEHVKKALKAGFHNRDWVGRDPDLLCLHDDPEFQNLIVPTKPEH
jgi:TolB-like protein/cytochrome c-type biogenesis protein CcmH/NrfG